MSVWIIFFFLGSLFFLCFLIFMANKIAKDGGFSKK